MSVGHCACEARLAAERLVADDAPSNVLGHNSERGFHVAAGDSNAETLHQGILRGIAARATPLNLRHDPLRILEGGSCPGRKKDAVGRSTASGRSMRSSCPTCPRTVVLDRTLTSPSRLPQTR